MYRRGKEAAQCSNAAILPHMKTFTSSMPRGPCISEEVENDRVLADQTSSNTSNLVV